MIRAIRFIMVSASLALGIVTSLQCSPGSRFNYIGTWEARRKLDKPIDPRINPDAVYQASRVDLTVKPDGTFTLVDAGMPRDGEYEIAGDHLVLNIKSIAGVPMSRQAPDIQSMNVPISVTPIPGSESVRYYDPKGFDRTGLVMSRVPDAKKPPAP